MCGSGSGTATRALRMLHVPGKAMRSRRRGVVSSEGIALLLSLVVPCKHHQMGSLQRKIKLV